MSRAAVVRIGELYALDDMAQCESMQLKTIRDISVLVRQRRARLGWSQERLAKRAGASRLWVIQLEKGKRTVQIAMVLRVLSALGVNLAASSPRASAVRRR